MSGPLSAQEIVARCLALSTADGCVVVVRESWQANLRWARNTLTTNGEGASRSVTVLSFVGSSGGGRTGTAVGAVNRSGVTVAELADLVERSQAAAAAADPAEDASPLLDRSTGTAAAVDWTEPPGTTSGGVFGTIAPVLGDVLAAGRADGIEHFGYAEHSVATTYVGSSTGLLLRHVQPEGRLELTAKSHQRSRSTWAGIPTRDFAGIDLPATDAGLRRALQWQARTVDIAPGRHAALLSPSAVADLMIDLYWSAGGRDAAQGRSVFSRPGGGTRIGEALSPQPFDLVSDPAMPGLQCSPFELVTSSSESASVFDNGLPLRRTEWLHAGRLRGLLTSRFTARECDLPVNPGIDNLSLSLPGAGGDLADLVSRSDSGLLVTCLWYNRVVDPQTLLLTGLTRDGVYLVSDGEVVGSVGNFRFNDSPVDMLRRTTDAGATTPTLAREMGDYFNRAAMPPLRVADVNFSTRSDAV
ncbi:MAG: TldD/PmbA family protein [Actinomycetota bacterium]|nr:MAG: TldD/PmbA family protein [Actinomycetota bacterium]